MTLRGTFFQGNGQLKLYVGNVNVRLRDGQALRTFQLY